MDLLRIAARIASSPLSEQPDYGSRSEDESEDSEEDKDEE